jgi:hypothetical protein
MKTRGLCIATEGIPDILMISNPLLPHLAQMYSFLNKNNAAVT